MSDHVRRAGSSSAPRPRFFRALVPLVATWLFGVVQPAQAGFVINANFDSTITNDPNVATIVSTINQAILVYENAINSNVTVNINFTENSASLGSSSTFFGQITYNQYLAALTANSVSADDATALAHLAAGPNNPVNGNTLVDVTTANLRALGFSAFPPAGQPDSTIGLQVGIMNLTRPPGDPGKYDLMAVVSHEIDEALGFGSALNGLANSPVQTPSGAIWGLDLYRFDQNGNRSLTTDPNAQAFLSFDGGVTRLVQFNQNAGGDYSDTVAGPIVHVQDAFATPGATPNLGVELRELDVLGYNLNTSSTVPEPSSFVLASLVGAVGLGSWWRRRKSN